MTVLRSALWVPLFGDLAEPGVVARLAAEAEEAGWDGVFVWDQLRWREPVEQVADPWITLAAVATATERVRLGPMVSPLPRRRPVRVAMETTTLDRLSGGRLTLGVGIGSDRFAGEFSKTGEQVDDRLRGQMLDEALLILTAAWSGEPVHHHGTHYVVDDMRLLPRPVQRPAVPVWVAGFPGNVKPMRRGPLRRVLPGQPRAPRPAGRGRGHRHRVPRRPGRTLRLRRRPPARHRPDAVCRGGRNLVAARVRAGDRVSRPGARCTPRRPGDALTTHAKLRSEISVRRPRGRGVLRRWPSQSAP
jgi:Luciferase-like monooxygenase